MKVKRLKHVRKVVGFYQYNYDFHPPLRVLIDGTFCKAALRFKINISEQLPKYLGCEVKLTTTPCAIAECQALGPLLYGPLKVLQQFHLNPCGHESPIPASMCLLTLLRKQNHHKFYIATQDSELSDRVRARAGIPLLFIAYNAITLEAPSDRSRRRADRQIQANIVPTDFHKTALDKLKADLLGPQPKTVKEKHIKHKVKGPNPLSCKKKKRDKKVQKPKTSESTVRKAGTTSRKRKKHKKTVHVT